MTARHLRLVVENVPGGRTLDGFRTLEGPPLDGPQTGHGVALELPGIRVYIDEPGVAPAISSFINGVLLVDARVAGVLRTLAPGDVELTPAEIDGEAEGSWFLLKVLSTVDCLDTEHSEEVQVFTPSSPDTPIHYGVVHGARLDAARAGAAQVFLLKGLEGWIIVRGEVHEALERAGVTGARFEDVSDVRTLAAPTREHKARCREAWQRTNATREEFLRGLSIQPGIQPNSSSDVSHAPRAHIRKWIIPRAGGRTLFITDGLSSPRPGTTDLGLGFELALETDEPVSDDFTDIWPLLSPLMTAVLMLSAETALRNPAARNALVTVDPYLPAEALLNTQGTVQVLVGVKPEGLPERIPLPGGEVRLMVMQAVLGPEGDWLLAGGSVEEVVERLRAAGHGHFTRLQRAPVVRPPPDFVAPPRPAPLPPPPEPYAFTLTEDLSALRRRVAGAPRTRAGEPLNLEPFLAEAPVTLEEAPGLTWSKPGEAQDFHLVEGKVPLVSARVAEVLREHAPEDVALFPVAVAAGEAPLFLVHVKHIVRCINDQRSSAVGRWTRENGGTPEQWGTYWWVKGLRITPRKMGPVRVCRPWGWPRALIVTEPVMQALLRAGATGLRFEYASGSAPDRDDADALHEQQVAHARTAFLDGLGTREADAMRQGGYDDFWPAARELHRIRRPEGRTLLVTQGLSSSRHLEVVPSTGIGLELLLELAVPLVDEEDAGWLKSWPERLIFTLGSELALAGLQQEVEALAVRSYQMPPELCGPDGSVGLVLGRPTAALPVGFRLPTGEVRAVTVTVLMREELLWILEEQHSVEELVRRLDAAGVDTVYRGMRPPVV